MSSPPYPDSAHLFYGELIEALRSLYPDLDALKQTGRDDVAQWVGGLAGTIRKLMEKRTKAITSGERFVDFTSREPDTFPIHPWNSIFRAGKLFAGLHYQGLLTYKTPHDLSLCSMLLWELKPKTVIEFGALQGGSALWLAHQLEAQLGEGHVHSFEYHLEAVSPRAKHSRLTFHRCDLHERERLDRKLLASLPHPWLVIDDAHIDSPGLLRWMSEYVQVGDYYVVEDDTLLFYHPQNEVLARALSDCHYQVDAFYCDNFGYNLTAAPNAWLRKMR